MLPPPTFTPIPSNLAFGPPIDISMGWDGTFWAIDATGAPHLFDPINNAWRPHGDGIDAAAWVGTTYYFFRGSQVVTAEYYKNTGTPQPIAALFPLLPDSFKLGVTAAANIGGKLYLVKGGWYLPADGSAPRAKLTALKNWPQTPNWVDGVIDATSSDGGTVCNLTRGGEYITVDFAVKAVTSSPAPISTFPPWQGHLPAEWAASGFDAAFTQSLNNTTVYTFFKGSAMVEFQPSDTGMAAQKYLGARYPNWPATWHPVLNHAPSGRMGNLWVPASGGRVLRHDGDTWNVTPGVGPSAGVGQDGSVYVIGTDGGLFHWDGTQFNPQGNLNDLVQVSVGDGNHVWVRDGSDTVHRYQGNNAFSPVDLGAGVPNPTHIAANADGTLWHCNSSNADIFRLISESTNPSETITVKGGVVTSVQKVASTGFGAAHCLVTQNGQPQLYRYDSPYVFKTSETYKVALSTTGSFGQGLGNLYFVQFVSEQHQRDELNVRIVALDAHSGREVATYPLPGNTSQYSEIIFDSVNELVYVGRAPFKYEDNSTPGQIIALDARTLAVKWTFTTPGGVDATPALNGTTLCFGDRTGVVYCLDTKQALAAVAQNQPISTRWTAPFDTNGPVHRVATPLFAGDQLIATMWDLESDPGEGLSLLTTVSLRLSDGNRTGASMPFTTAPRNEIEPRLVLGPPSLGQLLFPGFSTPSRALFIWAATKVVAFNLDNDQQNQYMEFPLPTGYIATCLTYDDGTRVGSALSNPDPSRTRLWFGDNQGNLWSLDNQLKPADGTPSLVKQNTEVFTTPVLYKDPQGGLTVLFGVFDSSGALPASLYGYDPDTRNRASLPTGVTSISTLSRSVTNGVIYAGGSAEFPTGGNPVQVFGIRVDTLPQTLRDFVIESQMMQDPDEHAPGGDPSNPTDPTPPSRARYQTHLTVVDDQKTPQPNEPIKIWADTPMTLMIEGRTFDVGPGDAAYASVKTGVDGALVITSGYAKSDGTDTPDMYAPALRVWAGFMDPYERIVVNPDHEFHGRVTTAHASANDDDPDKVNLVTTKSYAGRNGAKPTALFTSDEQQAGQPKNCASAVSQMKSGVDFGGASNSAKTLFNRLMLHTSGRKSAQRTLRAGKPGVAAATASPPKYVAYTDLTGSGYFPTNIPAQRPTTVAQPTGLIFSKPKGQPTTTTTFSIVPHADAQATIDALPPATVNPPWQSSSSGGQHERGVRVAQRVGENIFEEFWNWLKKVAAEITDLIVTIADEVMVGIRMVVNGIERVFKAIVKVIDDIAAAIGSFFHMLLKAIEDVIAALSVLFHFGEIIHTHKWIRDQINANLKQAVTTMQTQVKPSVDQFFQQGEQAIKDLFDNIRDKLGIDDATQINTVNSARSTPHTAFTAGPGAVGPDSGGSSHAVQCLHTTQKMKTGLPGAQPGQSGLSARPSPDDDDGKLSEFLTSFVTSLQGALADDFNNLKTAINKIGQSQSAGDFFKSALNLLLTIVEDLILGMVAVTQALVDGLIGAIGALINTAMTLLNTPVDIPFLSWLYQLIFGEPLTVLNAVSLIAAIPVTIIYRVAEGRYPSEDGITGSTVGLETSRTTATPDVLKKMQGLIGGCIALGLGIVRGVVDFIGTPPEGEEPSPTLRIGGIMVLVFSLGYISTFFPLMVPGPVPTAEVWAAWGLGLALALLGTFGLINLKDLPSAIQTFFKGVLTFLRVGLGIARFIVFIVAFVQSSNRNPVTDMQFARNLFLELPPMFNWLKLLAEPANMILVGIDVVTGVVVCTLDITAAFLHTESEPRLQRPLMA
ncbi:MAG TPA: PQQ-binding-like beta-propeller repeat protein [Nitrospiraceae bacterium]|nr:PQQ-binding-like beta-propeller repeat protein [Nitrospiraceae bacterium]